MGDGIFKRLFGGGAKKEAPAAVEHYLGFEVTAAPVQETNGWRVQGRITKEIEGELKEHVFIRADACGDRQSAVMLTLRKARQLIDEQGECIFR